MRYLPLLLVAACSITTPVPQARVKLGPARDARLRTVLAMPTECATANPEMCTEAQAVAVGTATRMALEFAGLRLVDSETVNAYLHERVTKTVGDVSRTEVAEKEGGTWLTASDDTRRRLLEELGIEAYLTTQIFVSRRKNVEDQRTISVTVSIIRARDLEPKWTSQCSVETGRYYFADEAISVAVRCALESALMVGT